MALLGAGLGAPETIRELDLGDSQGNKKTRRNKTRNFKTILGSRGGKIIRGARLLGDSTDCLVLATRDKRALEKVPDLKSPGQEHLKKKIHPLPTMNDGSNGSHVITYP